MPIERDSLVARLGKLHEYDLVLDTNAYPKGPMAEGRDVYRVIGWEGADRGGLLLSEVEAREVRAAFRESSAAAALSRPEQVVKARPTSDAWKLVPVEPTEEMIEAGGRSVFTREIWCDMLASAPASPTIGIQAVKALADRVRALLLVDQPASWEERRKIADELESLSALHPAPEAASAGAVEPTAGEVENLAEFLCAEFDTDMDPIVGAQWPQHAKDEGYRDGGYVRLQPIDVQAHARDNARRILKFLARPALPAHPDAATPSDTEPSPKGVSDGVREALRKTLTDMAAMRFGCSGMSLNEVNDWFNEQAHSALASLSQEHAQKGVSDGVRDVAALREALERWSNGWGYNEDSEADAELKDRADTALAALSQEPVPSTAEERAASEEGA